MKKIIIALIVAVILSVIAGGAWYYFKKKKATSPDTDTTGTGNATEPKISASFLSVMKSGGLASAVDSIKNIPSSRLKSSKSEVSKTESIKADKPVIMGKIQGGILDKMKK